MPRAPSSIVFAAIVGGLLTLATVSAQSGGDFDLGWWSAEGGGGVSQGGGYSLAGVAGQADASVEMAGGRFSLTGGFLTGAGAGSTSGSDNVTIFLPTACRSDGCRGAEEGLEGAQR